MSAVTLWLSASVSVMVDMIARYTTAVMVPLSWLAVLKRISGLVGADSCTGSVPSSRKRRTARALSRLPQLDQAVAFSSGGKSVDGRLEDLLLGGEEGSGLETGSLPQGQLDEQLGADVADVLDGCIEPTLACSATFGGGGKQESITAVAGLLVAASDQTVLHEPLDGPVTERSGQAPNLPEFAARSEQRADGPPVGDSFDDERQADLLRKRKIVRLDSGSPGGVPTTTGRSRRHGWAR